MKLIRLPHKVCPMTCMVNGLEDLYEAKTGTRLPDWFLFYMSGMAGFAYIKVSKAPVPRFVGWGAAVKNQYKVLSEVIGFTWKAVEGRSFSFALKAAQAIIDQGTPVILGALDMYHLPYYTKFYHTFHVPIHYVLMVGYDEARQVVFVQDCDRAEVQEVPITDLQHAWNVHVPGLSDKNTLHAFEFSAQVADVRSIAYAALRKKADVMLKPPASLLGIPGMRKLARELPGWPDELSSEQLNVCLRQAAEYTGSPPMLPRRLTGYTDAPDNHAGGRDGFANVLSQLAVTYHQPAWADAADLFKQSGQMLEKFTNALVDYLLGESKNLTMAAMLVNAIAGLEERAYRLVATAIEDEPDPDEIAWDA